MNTGTASRHLHNAWQNKNNQYSSTKTLTCTQKKKEKKKEIIDYNPSIKNS